MTNPDFLNIIVAKRDVVQGDIGSTLSVLQSLIRSPASARQWCGRVDIAFDGYNHTRDELFELVEIREFVYKLDEEFPFWLFFLSKAHFGLQCIMLCFLPPYLTQEAKAKIFPERLTRLLEDRWGPAMNHICEFVGMSEREVTQMSYDVIEYMRAG